MKIQKPEDTEKYINEIYYWYDPFELAVHEIKIKSIEKNIFKEPDQIYYKSRICADENGIKLLSGGWSDIKTNGIIQYQDNMLTSRQRAITMLIDGINRKITNLQGELTSLTNVHKILSKEITLTDS